MPPVHLLIKPASSLCSMRCRYCFYCDVAENRNTASYGIMTPETTEELVKNVYQHAEGSVSFSFQGGEPTLAGVGYYKHFHRMAAQYNTKKLPTAFSMQTNGYHMPEELAELLAEHDYLLGVSLDGTGKIHDSLRPDSRGEGTFRRVNETLHTLEKYGVQYNILCVVTETAAKNGAEIYKYFRSRHFRFIQFIPYVADFGREGEKHPFTLTNKQYARFLNTTFRLYTEDFKKGNYVSVRQFDNFVRLAAGISPECCGMSGVCYANIVVEADGSVYPCDFYVLDRWRMGNIVTDPIPALLNSEAARTFVEQSVPVEEKCRTCPCLPVCRGGCRRHRETADGGIGLNRYCEAYRDFFMNNAAALNEMAMLLRQQR